MSKPEGVFADLDSTNDAVRRKAADRLEQVCNPTDVDALLDSMTNADWYVRWKVLDVLGGLRELKALEAALRAVRDENAGVREAAVEALGNIGDPSAREAVSAALTDEDNHVRAKAAAAAAKLGKVGDPSSLLERLNDRQASVRISAAQALAALGDRRAAGLVGAAAASEAESLARCFLAEAAAKLGDSLGRTILANLATSEDQYARQAAVAALKRLSTMPASTPAPPVQSAATAGGWQPNDQVVDYPPKQGVETERTPTAGSSSMRPSRMPKRWWEFWR